MTKIAEAEFNALVHRLFEADIITNIKVTPLRVPVMEEPNYIRKED